MHLKAISIGCAVPRMDFDATVHSAFRSAVNLRLTDESNLLTLVTSNEADLPQGIRVDTPDDFSFEIFRTGELITCRNHLLRFTSSALTIDPRAAVGFSCNLPALQADMTNPSVVTAWQSVWLILNKQQIQSKAEIIAQDLFRSDESIRVGVSRKAGESMQSLFESARRYDQITAFPVYPLIGLGTGLTPSGDDLLVGYLAGLWCAVQGKNERIQFVSHLGKVTTGLSHRTNDISRTYLYHAAQGQVSSRLANLAEAICRGEKADLYAIAQSAMQTGHTSGMDTVTGLLIGLVNWSGRDITDLSAAIQPTPHS